MSERAFILRSWAKALWSWVREPQTNRYREKKERQAAAKREAERSLGWRR